MSQQWLLEWSAAATGQGQQTTIHRLDANGADLQSSGGVTSNSSLLWSANPSNDQLWPSSVPSSQDELAAGPRGNIQSTPQQNDASTGSRDLGQVWQDEQLPDASPESFPQHHLSPYQPGIYTEQVPSIAPHFQRQQHRVDGSEPASNTPIDRSTAHPSDQMLSTAPNLQTYHTTQTVMAPVFPTIDWRLYVICPLWRSFYPACGPDRMTQQNLYEIFGIESQAAAANAFFGHLYQDCSQSATQRLPSGHDLQFLDAFLKIWQYINPTEELSRDKAQKISDVLRRPVSVQEILNRARRMGACARDIEHFEDVVDQITAKLKNNQNACGQQESRPSQQGNTTSRSFECTNMCGSRFQKKRAWVLHEEKNWRQQVWICKFLGCNERNSSGRAKFTRQNYVDHIARMHRDHSPVENEEDGALFSVESNFPRSCSTYFPQCGYDFKDWDDRNDHLAREHFKKGHSLTGPSGANGENGYDGDNDMNNVDDVDDVDFSGSNGRRSSGARTTDSKPSRNNITGAMNSSSKQYHAQTMLTAEGIDQTSERPARSAREKEPPDFKVRLNNTEDKFSTRLLHKWSAYFKCLVIGHRPDQVNLLSRTSSVTVERVSYLSGRYVFARKVIYAPGGASKGLLQEAKILQSIRHENVVQYLAHFNHHDHLYILMHPAADTDLLHFMRFAPRDEIRQLRPWRWFSGLAEGLQYIHSLGFRHRDIKPSNILIQGEKVLFTDFGLSNLVEDDRSDEKQWEYCTKRYAAPEMWTGTRGRPADIWSLGCVFAEVMHFLLLRFATEHTMLVKFKRLQLGTNWIFAKNSRIVCKWMDALEAAAYSIPLLGEEYSGLEEYALLVIGISRQMLQMAPDDRPTATEIANLVSLPTARKINGKLIRRSHLILSLLCSDTLRLLAWDIMLLSTTTLELNVVSPEVDYPKDLFLGTMQNIPLTTQLSQSRLLSQLALTAVGQQHGKTALHIGMAHAHFKVALALSSHTSHWQVKKSYLDMELIRRWINQGTSQFLWLRGTWGTGKSILTAGLVSPTQKRGAWAINVCLKSANANLLFIWDALDEWGSTIPHVKTQSRFFEIGDTDQERCAVLLVSSLCKTRKTFFCPESKDTSRKSLNGHGTGIQNVQEMQAKSEKEREGRVREIKMRAIIDIPYVSMAQQEDLNFPSADYHTQVLSFIPTAFEDIEEKMRTIHSHVMKDEDHNMPPSWEDGCKDQKRTPDKAATALNPSNLCEATASLSDESNKATIERSLCEELRIVIRKVETRKLAGHGAESKRWKRERMDMSSMITSYRSGKKLSQQ